MTQLTENGHQENELIIDSDDVVYTEEYIHSQYQYQTSIVDRIGNSYKIQPKNIECRLRTERTVPKLGVMLVGWGGNNGSTLTGAVLANRFKLEWETRNGQEKSNWFGSYTQAATTSIGLDEAGNEIFIPIRQLLPMVNGEDIEFDGWDISNMNLADAMIRAKVFEPELRKQLSPLMKEMVPRKSIYIPNYIAANQEDRANNVIELTDGFLMDLVEVIRNDIRDFRKKVDKIIVLWTANTERFSSIIPGVNDHSSTLLDMCRKTKINDHSVEIAPSTLFAMAAILENVPYINGSPQNTFVPGLIELAEEHNAFIAGDDFKTGQTKLKSVLVDFLVSCGIKPVSIVSYNHLGNNDGKNLSAPQQFRSKEISKTNVVDDMVKSNKLLYETNDKPDHCVVIKYVPYVGDSKRAMDEYTCQIMMGGHQTFVIHNTCEDSLLAAPLILDLIIVTELLTRIQIAVTDNEEMELNFQSFHSILSFLSLFLKAPLSPDGIPVVNSLFRQKSALENLFRACIGLPPINNMLLEHRVQPLIDSLQMPKYGKANGKTATENGTNNNIVSSSTVVGKKTINGTVNKQSEKQMMK
ncbi:hypothetical protein SNEBB_000837 [Seison nebaliae]|nr:hypothetical protein SNEBB_000837 [Seison nebaliae]